MPKNCHRLKANLSYRDSISKLRKSKHTHKEKKEKHQIYHKSSTPAVKAEACGEFKATLVNIVSSKLAKATEKDPISKRRRKRKKK